MFKRECFYRCIFGDTPSQTILDRRLFIPHTIRINSMYKNMNAKFAFLAYFIKILLLVILLCDCNFKLLS
jgi:hypothetical protein